MKTSLTILLSGIALISMAVITIFLVNSLNRKMFLITSSLAHISWMLVRSITIKMACLVYLSIYSFIIMPIVVHIKKLKTSNLRINQENRAKINIIAFKINFISLSGLPPFTGFFLKALVVFLLILCNSPTKMVLTLLVLATGAFYAYSQIMMKIILREMLNKKEKKAVKISIAKKAIV